MRATAPWLLAFSVIAPVSLIARAEGTSHAETSEEKAEKGDATEINK